MSSLLPLMDDDAPAPRRRERGAVRTRRSRLPVVFAGGVLVVIALLGVAVILVALDARTAYAELRAAMPQVSELKAQVLAGETEAAAATSAELQDHTSTARDALHGPHWALAGVVPGIGPNVDAAQTAAVVVDDLATDVLPDLVAVTDAVSPAALAPVDGRIDLAPFTAAVPQVLAANDAVAAATDRLGTIEWDAVHERLRTPLVELETELDDVASLTETAARAVQLIPPMLGADEPRQYLLMVQNNAEPRSTGGLTGAFVLLRAEAGAIELVDQGPAGFLGSYTEPVLELADAEVALFGDQIGRYPGNITATPDFRRSAELASAMWRQTHGSDLDGVLSIDPVALGSMLAATGPVTLPTGQVLTAENAAQTMLNTVYLEIPDPAMQDAFFQTAAATIFSEVTAGGGNPVAAVGALTLAADDGRLMVWPAREEEQALLAGSTLTGELRGRDGDAPVVGVYLNDLSAAKMAYYQRMSVDVTTRACHPDGSQDLTVAVTLASEAPENAADLPVSLAGIGQVVAPGDMRSHLLVYAPEGGRITAVRAADGTPQPVLPHVHDGLVVAAREVILAPGEASTAEYDMTTSSATPETAVTRTTPGSGSGKFAASVTTCMD